MVQGVSPSAPEVEDILREPSFVLMDYNLELRDSAFLRSSLQNKTFVDVKATAPTAIRERPTCIQGLRGSIIDFILVNRAAQDKVAQYT